MDDLLSEFLTETAEAMETLDTELVRLEQDPNDAEIISNIFRLVHTIKGTCGFLGLPRLETLAHAAENVMSKIRDGELTVTAEIVSLVLASLDQIKNLLRELEENEAEPEGDDNELKQRLNHLAETGELMAGGNYSTAAAEVPQEDVEPAEPAPEPEAPPAEEPAAEEGGDDNDELQALFDATPYTGPGAEEMAQRVAELQGGDGNEAGEAPEEAAAAEPEPKVPVPAEAPAAKEDKPGRRKDASGKESGVTQTIRVNVDLLENLMTMVSELVLTRNQLLQILRTQKDSDFGTPLQRLSHVTSELQEGVMKTRMQPIGNAWAKLPRIVRDLSIELSKKIDLQMIGADTELDRQVLELIKDPLTHMVRNSADHGIEDPKTRADAGKSETGTITLNAFHEGGHIVIEISDDGRGLNADKIKEKVIRNGLATEADVESMGDHQLQQFIFSAGFSTAAAVTSVSGRGVGMDVVKTNIDKIGGTVELKSVEGKGTTFLIKIPLTLAIVSALVIECASERFAIPQISVVELVRTSDNSEHQIEVVHDAPVLRLRNRLLPLVSLRELLGMEQTGAEAEPSEKFIVVSQVGTYSFGIIVDRVFDTEEIVVKPVAPVLRSVPIFSGNTILGDGSVIMILDPNGIATETGEITVSDHAAHEAGAMREAADEERIALLLFRASDATPKAVPLGLVARLEEIDLQQVEYSDGKAMVQYRGSLMPLVPVDPSEQLPKEGKKPVLVFSDRERSMGVVVNEILDIVEERLSVELGSESAGMVGSAIVAGQATDIIDTGYFLTLAFSDWFGSQHESTLADAGQRRRLLLVDDSAFFRNLLTPLLSVSGYTVVAVGSAKDALDLCEAGENFDIIVSDIEMPDMDGFQLCAALRDGTKWAQLPIIAMTSHTTDQDIERGREAGFTDYLAKHDRDALLHALEETIGSPV